MFDEPRKLPSALVSKIYAVQPMRDWFVMRVLSRHLLTQSALLGARPAHFFCCYADLVTRIERHRPYALEVTRGNDREAYVDQTVARLSQFTFLRRLTLRVPYESGVINFDGVRHSRRRALLGAILRDLVALEFLKLWALTDLDGTLDFSRLTALTRLEIDGAFHTKIAHTFPRSLAAFAFHGNLYDERVACDAFRAIPPHVTTLEITATWATVATAIAECAPTLTDLTWGTESYSLMSLKHIERCRNLRRLCVRGVVDERTDPCANKVDGVAPSVGDIRATFGRWTKLPALEHLNLSRVLVYCASESDASRERAMFESRSGTCVEIESPQWVGGISVPEYACS